MRHKRASGILLHPTSLPGRFGIGDLGPSAIEFIDFLAETGQHWWQILPIGPTGGSNSPYEGRTRPSRARPLQENRLPHCIQGAEMTVLSDVALPQADVLGSTMAYREAGHSEAPVALFLHGNPTSSYIWRNILPLVAPVAHCVAPRLQFGFLGPAAPVPP